MKRISYWGKRHPWKTRLIIVLIQLLLGSFAALGGIWLYAQGWTFPAFLLQTAIALFLIATFFYPEKRSRFLWFRHSYRRQKGMDFALLIISLFMVTTVGNQYTHSLMTESPAFRAEFMVHKTQSRQLKETRRGIGESLKSQRQAFRAEVKALAKELKGRKVTAEQVVLIFLTIVGAVALLILVGYLSCALACSGSDGLAILVAVTGLGLVVWLTIVLIKKILRMKVATP